MKVLLLNQCFHPDVMATGQYLTELALALSEQGHDVTVLTSDRGYDDPTLRFPRREIWNRIRIIRIPSVSLGKRSRWRRALNFGSFLSICAVRLLFLRRFDVVVALTSPPLISFFGALFTRIKGGRFCFWVMDLNPHEAIAAGWLKPDAVSTRLLIRVLNYSLRTAETIVVLDRFMKDRVVAMGHDEQRVRIIPPWTDDAIVRYDAEGRHRFRTAHSLDDKFVIMYSGNHSPCHPLDTLLGAALSFKENEHFAFCFVGGGSEQTKVREFAERQELTNLLCLPYQAISELPGSLSAADLHVVVMGDQFVGIVHPCKIYNIMAVGGPTLYIGPRPSHVTDIAEGSDLFYMAHHGDVDRVAAAIRQAAERDTRRNQQPVGFAKRSLLPELIEIIESKQLQANDVPPAATAPLLYQNREQ